MNLGRKILAGVLLFVALVAVNYLASTLPVRIDATAERIYTLSPGTRSLLAKIDPPITLDLYFSRNTSGQFVAYKNYADRVREMLRQYVRAAHGKLILREIDPAPDTPEEEKAAAAGLEPQTLPGGGDAFYFGLVATQAEQQKAIPVLSPDREQFLEYDLSELIYGVQQAEKKKLGLITSLPLQGSSDPMTGAASDPAFVVKEWEETYAIVPVDASAAALPAGLDALAIVHPENLAPGLQFSIDQFLLAGHPVFLAVDPSSVYFKRQAGQMAMLGGSPPGASSDLPALLGGWGIGYDPAKVVGDLSAALSAQSENGSSVSYPVWLDLEQANFNAQALPTAQLSSLWFIEPGSLTLKPGSSLDFVPLVRTSAQAGEVDAGALQMSQPEDIARQIKPSGPKTIAALVTGAFPTAFPKGAPGKASAKAPPALRRSAASSTLIVVADTDWLIDDFSVRKFDLFGQTAAEPLNDNLAFAANALDFLAGSQDLISIRGKGNSIRPFTVIQKMTAKANEKYQEKLGALESQLDAVQSKLSELQGKATEGSKLVATPAVAKAIEDFQKQSAALRAERRSIRLVLRQGIDALENRLIVFNLLASPLLIAAFGLWFGRRRRRTV